MKKRLTTMFLFALGFYVLILLFLYFFQEKLIFFPEQLPSAYQFEFAQPFDEINVRANDGKLINGILFKADSSKGLIFYLHGNAGSLRSWGEVAETYTALGYDVFMLDYRGYGKSEGTISGQEQLYQDNQTIYDTLKQSYSEDKIVVLGYSIGTGLAAKLASTNNPRLLILQAPYYSLEDVMRRTYKLVPTFLLKYKFATNEYLKLCEMPVVIFHGNQDEVIYYGSSIKLKEGFKPQDTLITLNGHGHNGMTYNSEYRMAIKQILAR